MLLLLLLPLSRRIWRWRGGPERVGGGGGGILLVLTRPRVGFPRLSCGRGLEELRKELLCGARVLGLREKLTQGVKLVIAAVRPQRLDEGVHLYAPCWSGHERGYGRAYGHGRGRGRHLR